MHLCALFWDAREVFEVLLQRKREREKRGTQKETEGIGVSFPFLESVIHIFDLII